MKEILDVVHKTIYQFFDVCGDKEEAPLSDKDKLLLKVNKAICNNLKALEKEPIMDEIILTKEEYGELVSSEFDNGYAKGYREALEQESVLDNIRAEIWDLQYGDEERNMTDKNRVDAYNNAIRQVIEIIDKYKAESEDKE